MSSSAYEGVQPVLSFCTAWLNKLCRVVFYDFGGDYMHNSVHRIHGAVPAMTPNN